MGVFAQIKNRCNHCGGEFVYSYSTTICPKCFLAGHRFSDCGPHCKATEASTAQAEATIFALSKLAEKKS